MKILHNNELDDSVIDWPVYMQRALDLAGNVLTAAPNPRVGCVIVKNQEIIAEGWHRAAGLPHAEAMALDSASQSCQGATAFVSLEPCNHQGKTGPCTEAMISAGITRVVIAMVDPNPRVAGKGIAKLEVAGIEVIQLLDFETQARQLNTGYVKRFEKGMSLLRMKLAMSLDGRTALANGQSKWITSDAAREDVQRLRAQSSAIVTGSGTVLADDPQLNVRTEELGLSESQLLSNADCLARQPLRVVLDSRLRSPGVARIFQGEGPVVVFTNSKNPEIAKDLPGSVDIRQLPAEQSDGESGVNLASVLKSLAVDFECNEVLLEAGPTLCGAFLKAGLLDELVIYIAPRIFGSDARPLLNVQGIESLTNTYDFSISELSQLGPDIKVILRPES